MAYNDTRITVCGIVASKIAHSKVGTGFSRAGFRIHSQEQRFDRGKEDWTAGPHMFLMVTCWRELADNVHASLNRGDPVVVHGRVRVREFTENGRTSQVVDIEASAVGPDLASCTAHPVHDPDPAGAVVVAPRNEDELPLAFAGVSLNRPASRPPPGTGPPAEPPASPEPARSRDPDPSPGSGGPAGLGRPPTDHRAPATQCREVSQTSS
ncbi:single-stranded DNA-binding protein [Actinosynnema sp. NPDC023587]|uniref:single-stranded DNA-binding protein n=1 Tax=Actinosynnema sp. NPDC023587 TaxID=3154695 RepID=UPI0033DC5FFE